MQDTYVGINGKVYPVELVKTHLIYLIKVIGKTKGIKGLKDINIKNNKLIESMGIQYYGPEGTRTFLTNFGLCKKASSGLPGICSTFDISIGNLCLFLKEFQQCTGEYVDISPAYNVIRYYGKEEEFGDFLSKYASKELDSSTEIPQSNQIYIMTLFSSFKDYDEQGLNYCMKRMLEGEKMFREHLTH